MVRIEISDEMIDWLEQHAYGLSREDCVEFAQEFVSFIMMTGALVINGAPLIDLPPCDCGMGDGSMPELHARDCAINLALPASEKRT